jgi:hypothetical protein
MWSGNNLSEFTEGDPVRVNEEKELTSDIRCLMFDV